MCTPTAAYKQCAAHACREEGSKAMLARITGLINDVVTKEDPSVKLAPEDVLGLIGGVSCASSREGHV